MPVINWVIDHAGPGYLTWWILAALAVAFMVIIISMLLPGRSKVDINDYDSEGHPLHRAER